MPVLVLGDLVNVCKDDLCDLHIVHRDAVDDKACHLGPELLDVGYNCFFGKSKVIPNASWSCSRTSLVAVLLGPVILAATSSVRVYLLMLLILLSYVVLLLMMTVIPVTAPSLAPITTWLIRL